MADKYVLSKAYREMANELNKAYDEMKEHRISTNSTRLFEQTLESFYSRNNIDVKDVHRISTRKQMTEEQAEELGDIVDMFVDIALNDGGLYYSEFTKGMTQEDLDFLNDFIADEDYENIETDTKEEKWQQFEYDTYQKLKEKYGFGSVQEYANWLDNITRMKMNPFVREILSSDQMGEIIAIMQNDYDYGHIVSLITEEYYNTNGATGDVLYDAIINRISK